jgi:hypothetical protein
MDLLWVIRQSPYNRDCALLVLSAQQGITPVRQALSVYGVYDFLEKTDFKSHHFLEIARAATHEARLKKAAAKARTWHYLTVTFNEAVELKKQIESSLQELGMPSVVTLLLGPKATYDKVSDALRSGRYHIFHYAGHGLYDESLSETSGLVLYKNNGSGA